jgi:hypothetical protein
VHKRSCYNKWYGHLLIYSKVLEVNDARCQRRGIKRLISVDAVVGVQELYGADCREDWFVVDTHTYFLRECREFETPHVLKGFNIR